MIDFQMQGSIILLLLFFGIFLFLMFKYWNLIRFKIKYSKFIIFGLRAIILIFTIILLLDPILHWSGKKERNPIVSILIDSSQSIAHHIELANFRSVIDKITQWLDDSNATYTLELFGDKTRIIDDSANIHFTDNTTDFTFLPEKLNRNNSDLDILLSDGVSTAGLELSSLKFGNIKPIYTIGIGSPLAGEDIMIDHVKHPHSIVQGDSAEITVSIKFSLTESKSTHLILKSKDNELLYSKPIRIESGAGYLEIPIKLSSDKFTDFIYVNLQPVEGEKRTDNNNYSFNVEVLSGKEHILLLSGALSSNTEFIKTILEKLPRSNLNHYFRLNNLRWKDDISSIFENSPKIIVLDDFPNYGNDRTLFNKVTDYCERNGTSLIYFEGPSADINSANLISASFDLIIQNDAREVLQSVNVGNNIFKFTELNDVNSIPPQRRHFKWIASADRKIVEYSDGAAAMTRTNKIYPQIGIFMPEISRLHLKLGPSEYPDVISKLIYNVVLNELVSESSLIKLFSDKSSYYIGDVVEFNAVINEAITNPPAGIKIRIKNEQEQIFEEIPAHFDQTDKMYKTHYIPQLSGNWGTDAVVFWDNGDEIVSKIKNLSVQEIHTEDKVLTPDFPGLKRVASVTNGIYCHVDVLDSLINSIEIKPVMEGFDYRLTSFSMQKYWWILIVLFAIEWFIRKRIGLL